MPQLLSQSSNTWRVAYISSLVGLRITRSSAKSKIFSYPYIPGISTPLACERILVASAFIKTLNKVGDNGHPCLSPFSYVKEGEIPKAVRTQHLPSL